MLASSLRGSWQCGGTTIEEWIWDNEDGLPAGEVKQKRAGIDMSVDYRRFRLSYGFGYARAREKHLDDIVSHYDMSSHMNVLDGPDHLQQLLK